MKEGTYRILVVDDDLSVREMMSTILAEFGEVNVAKDGSDAREKIKRKEYDIVLLDYLLPDTDGLVLLKEFKELQPRAEFILITLVREIRVAVEAIKAGAFDYIHKDFELEDLKALILKAIERLNRNQEILYLRSEVERLTDQEFIFGHSEKMRRIKEVLDRAAGTSATVLLQGESGTGKELVARYLHRHSTRVHQPFVAINMASIPDNLVESTLFGHEKGAFTGALRTNYGKFELADGGTLFCDEISDLKMELQAKLLRVMQENEIERVGGQKPIPVDVRIIAATNRDLKTLVEEEAFREDLFYRLNVVPVHLPALRERIEDISLFVNFFLNKYNRKYGRNLKFSQEAMWVISQYDWPGNIRELENLIARLVVIHPTGEIFAEDVPFDYRSTDQSLLEKPGEEVDRLKVATESFERGLILRTLERENWHQERTAAKLGIHRKTLEYKLKKYNLTETVDQRKRNHREN